VPKSRVRARNGLLPREAAFVHEFPRDFNATRAAIRAGYSRKTAHVQGSQILRRLRVQAALEAHLATLTAKADVSAERVVQELAKIAFSDIRKFSAWTARRARLTPSGSLQDGAAACIQEVSGLGGGVRIKLHDKVAALAKLLKYIGVPAKSVEVPAADQRPGHVTIYIPDNGRNPSALAATRNGHFPP
jgi:phage terminase small subunit